MGQYIEFTRNVKISSQVLLQLLVLYVTVSDGFRDKYDFIVVGAGAGGSTVARRLSESGEFTVLLIESGGVQPEDYEIPAYATRVFATPASDFTFSYTSVPQRHAALLTNGVVTTISGRMLGGTTSLNGMGFSRGNPRCYDNWANLTGDPSWKYDNMLPYMKNVESYKGDFPSDQHGYSGPVVVSSLQYAPGLKEYWLEAGRELGYYVGDPNGPQREGFAGFEWSKKFGRRVDAYNAYVKPVLESLPLLDVLTNTNVSQIIFAHERAVAVRIHSKSPDMPLDTIILASKEIIVCGGTFNSPLLLQRSGIGPADVLRQARIPLVKDLPVGLNLQEHPMTGITVAINNNSASVLEDETRDLNPETWDYYNEFGDGPYSSTRAVSGVAFLTSTVSNLAGESHWPDIQVIMAHCVQALQPLQVQAAEVSPGEFTINMYAYITRPRSRGSIKVNPDDIYGNPILDFGYLSDKRDLQIMVEGLKAIVNIAEGTAAYGKLKAHFVPPSLPACNRFKFRSDEYWKCYVAQTTWTGCHSAGTNKMGHKNDPTAVVDSELRVIGIQGLRIADASIMAEITNTNTQAAVYAIAEKASDMILKSWTSRNLRT